MTVWEYVYHPERGGLVEVRRDGAVVASYAYDANGNRTSWSDFWGSSTASYDAQDRMLSAGEATYEYSAHGELRTKSAGSETTNYVYDVQGALRSVTLPTGVAIAYVTDAQGRRIGKRVDGALVQGWIYAGGLAPIAETDGSGAITTRYVYGTRANVPEYLIRGGSTYRIVTDHLGSVRLVIDASDGTVVQRIDYDAFGRVTLDTNPGWQPFGFAGGMYEPQTGLVRFGARDYDAEVGRWTAKDPIGFAGGSAGLYEYCGNDPVGASDALGLLTIFVHGTWSDFASAFPEDFVNRVTEHFGDPKYQAFSWSGKNRHSDRLDAGTRLRKLIRRYQARHPGEPIRVVAHSHGGNLALAASQSSDLQFDLYSLGTPILKEYPPGPALSRWYNVFSTSDQVQILPTGATRQHADATNVRVLNYTHSELHSVKAWEEAFGNEP